MTTKKTLGQWMHDLGLDIAQLVERARLDRKVVEAIVAGRYTTSPKQREKIAAAIGVAADQVQWGGAVSVDHMYGHGPQFGRSP